jgi:hypothetical protein
MKQAAVSSLALLLLVAATISCKNKDLPKPVNQLVGNWELVWITGGIAGIQMTPAQFGHTANYALYPDSTCSIIRDGHLVTTTYGTNIDSPHYYTLGTRTITFRNDGATYVYSFAHDTLQFYPKGLSDGFTEWYVRK